MKTLLLYVIFILPVIHITSCKKEVTQAITPAPSGNKPPVANAGSDQTITLPINAITLDGSKSTAPQNNITSYAWTKLSGPLSSPIANAKAVKTEVTNLTQGVYDFELKVTDAGGLISKDTMQVTVKPVQPLSLTTVNPFPGSTYIGNLSVARTNMAIAFANNKILVAGGWNGHYALNTLDIIDLTTSTVSSKPLSIARYGISAVASGNKIYLAGGEGQGFYTVTNLIDIYDANTDSFSNMTLSVARGYTAAASVGDLVIFAGGSLDYGNASSRVDIYNTVTKTWSRAELSEGRYNMAVAVVGNKVVFAGGTSKLGSSKAVDVYDYSTNTWSTNKLTEPRQALEAAVVNNKIYFAGGASRTVEILDMNTNQWSALLLSESKALIKIATSNNKIAFIGGAIGVDDYSKLIEIFNPATNTWTYQYMNTDLFEEAVISIGNNIYSAGGVIDGGVHFISGIFRFTL